jgi:hypothetical protein
MVLNLIKGFFCIYWEDQLDIVFASINVLYYIYLFVYIKPSLHPWDGANLFMVNGLSDMFWIWFAIILLRIFASMFFKEIGL